MNECIIVSKVCNLLAAARSYSSKVSQATLCRTQSCNALLKVKSKQLRTFYWFFIGFKIKYLEEQQCLISLSGLIVEFIEKPKTLGESKKRRKKLLYHHK